MTTITTLALGLTLATASAYAVEPFRPYDNFATTPLDSARWQEVERVRVIRNGALNLLQRNLSANIADSGVAFYSWSESVANPAAVTAIKARITVNAVEAQACTTNPAVVQSRARIVGTFFNVGTPVPGSQVGDVLAQVRLTRASNSADPAGVLRVQGIASVCTNTDCSGTTTIGNIVDLGTTPLGQATTVQLQWDQPGRAFLFSRDNGANSGSVGYTESHALPPTLPFKQLSTRMEVANCLSAPRVSGLVDARFDNVQVNKSAAP
jgi:hypothetical protein